MLAIKKKKKGNREIEKEREEYFSGGVLLRQENVHITSIFQTSGP